MLELQQELGLVFLFHKPRHGVVRTGRPLFGVMYLGRIVEMGTGRHFCVRKPAAPYTKP